MKIDLRDEIPLKFSSFHYKDIIDAIWEYEMPNMPGWPMYKEGRSKNAYSALHYLFITDMLEIQLINNVPFYRQTSLSRIVEY